MTQKRPTLEAHSVFIEQLTPFCILYARIKQVYILFPLRSLF